MPFFIRYRLFGNTSPLEKISVVEAAQHRPYELIKTKIVKTLEKFQGNDLSESVFGKYFRPFILLITHEAPTPQCSQTHTQTIRRQQPKN